MDRETWSKTKAKGSDQFPLHQVNATDGQGSTLDGDETWIPCHYIKRDRYTHRHRVRDQIATLVHFFLLVNLLRETSIKT